MDLNMTDILVHGKEYASNCSRNDNLGDTTLRLDSLGFGRRKTARSGDSHKSNDCSSTDDGCKLFLGLGPSLCHDDYYPIAAKKAKQTVTLFSQTLASDVDSGLLKLGLSRGTGESVLNMEPSHQCSAYLQEHLSASGKSLIFPVVDEGSTSAKRNSGGYMPSLLLAPRLENSADSKGFTGSHDLLDVETDVNVTSGELPDQLQLSSEQSVRTDCSVGTVSDSTFVGLNSDHRTNHHHPKKCRFKGCSKGARGASGLCISHGGGQRCHKPGCNKGAESRTAYCKAHGGGRRCQQLGCTKSAEGKTDFCIAHGGGRRCGQQGCTKAARGKSGLCIRHGGGKRCSVEDCSRSAEGQAGLCISHGGGRRCQHPGCPKGAQGSTMHCKAHGGGRRCIFEGCTKGAEGSTPLCKGHGGGKRCLYEGGGVCPKSVHGGTDYCVAHGGGKRCTVSGCTKSARGRTDCCVRHGGGKRCKIESCGKSAQGSTDFCKAHGGGKRCTWGQGCEKFARGKSGLCAAHGSMLAIQQDQVAGNSGSMISPALFHGLVSESTTVGSSVDNEHSSSAASIVSDSAESPENVGRRLVLPPQCLVPMSLKSSSAPSALMGVERVEVRRNRSFEFVIPEGRVHGGGLMSLLGGNLRNVGVGEEP